MNLLKTINTKSFPIYILLEANLFYIKLEFLSLFENTDPTDLFNKCFYACPIYYGPLHERIAALLPENLSLN